MSSVQGSQLKRGLSMKMKKNIIACQPFKNGVSTIICSGCHALMAYPAGSEKVKCSACNTLTTGIKVPCTSCKAPLRLPIKLDNAVCNKCGYKFQPISTFRLALPPGKEIRHVEAHQIIENDLKKRTSQVVLIRITLVPADVLKSEYDEVNVRCATNRKLSSNISGWCSALGVSPSKILLKDGAGEVFDQDKTPEELGLKEDTRVHVDRERDVSVLGTHHFVTHQFLKPTNCGNCHKFVWGLWKQGKWCSKCHLPVHHRCSKKVTKVCEQYTREACGLSFDDFGDPEESNLDQDVPEGFPIDLDDMEDWEEMCKPCASKEYRKDSFMSTFGKLCDWSDEEIAEIWKRYDKDANGSLDKDELTQFIGDLTGAEGGAFSDEELKGEVDRVLKRMDTNSNGIIEWEEFWYFHQAQKASDFLANFQGVTLTEEQAKEIWDQYDEDGSGELDNDEVRALLRDIANTAGVTLSDLGQEATGFWELGELVTWDKFREVFLPLLTETLAFDDDDYDDDDLDQEDE